MAVAAAAQLTCRSLAIMFILMISAIIGGIVYLIMRKKTAANAS